MFSQEQLAVASQLAEEIESSPWHVAVSRDNRKAQVIDNQGRSVFGGSWTLSPKEAEKIVAIRSLMPILVKALTKEQALLKEMKDTTCNLRLVFEELKNYEELYVWAEKALTLIKALDS